MSFELIQGNAIEVMRGLPENSIHCAITSPPYLGLRDFGLAPLIWGGDEACEHEWGRILPPKPGRGNKSGDFSTSSLTNPRRQDELPRPNNSGSFCVKCNAWRGSLGLEVSPEIYIEHLVIIFRELRRVLRDDGSFWLNIGDSYWGGKHTFLKPKDLCCIPWRLAMALQMDGWYLRAAMPWLKRNGMPGSETDIPTTTIEYFFMLTKSKKTFYDPEAVKLQANYDGRKEMMMKGSQKYKQIVNPAQSAQSFHSGGHPRWIKDDDGNYTRLRRSSDWFFESWQGMLLDEAGEPMAMIANTASFKDAHFATFPERVVSPAIAAGTSERGCCKTCGAPWERVVQKKMPPLRKVNTNGPHGEHGLFGKSRRDGSIETKTVGWKPTCSCSSNEPVPCTVLDPFCGSGTTAAVAHKMGRHGIGIELNKEYIRLAGRRMEKAGILL